MLRQDEVPSENLPKLRTHVNAPVKRKPPKERAYSQAPPQREKANPEPKYREVGVNTDLCGSAIESELTCLRTKILELEQQLKDLKLKLDKQKFCLTNICSDDSKVAFYTGFPSQSSLQACYNFLGPAVSKLSHIPTAEETTRKCGRPRSLLPEDEFFLILVRIRLGLMEQDLADRFGVSQSTVSRITTTWINFLYLRLSFVATPRPCAVLYAPSI